MMFENAGREYKKRLESNRERFEKAGESIKTIQEMENLFHEHEALLQRASTGEIDTETYMLEKERLDTALGAVEVDSIMELRTLLIEAGYADEEADYWAAHENAHANKAQELGLPVQYQVFRATHRDADGTVTRKILPAVSVGYNAEQTHAERAKDNRAVTSAPDELSEGDKRVLGSFDKGN